MSKTFIGRQGNLKATKIIQEKGYLGTYPRSLEPGDVQVMQFSENDIGPFYMKPSERQARRYDHILTGKTTTRTLTKKDLHQVAGSRKVNKRKACQFTKS
jgi:hypothetical protein